MSTTTRTARMVTRAQPLSRGSPAMGRPWLRGLAELFRWAAARPWLTSITLTLVYLVTLGGLIAVLSAQALGTVIGTGVLVLFAAEVLGFMAIAVYTVLPEQ